MGEPDKETRGALQHVRAPWDDTRTERCVAGIPERLRRRRQRRFAAAGGMTAVALLGAFLSLRGWSPSDTPAPVASSSAPAPSTHGHVALADGSRMEGLSADARFQLVHASDRRVEVDQTGGAVRYQVTPGLDRAFSVRAGGVTVNVLGTRFVVTRDGAQVRVEVERGRVAVRWPGGEAELVAGATGTFPPPAAVKTDPSSAGATVDADGGAAADVPATTRPNTRMPRRRTGTARASGTAAPAPNWHEQARKGDFGAAYLSLANGPRPSTSEELLLAADAARLSGHPQDAVGFLRQVMRDHPGDARAPLAAFTLGNVYMNQLGLPREAEAAYAQARKGTRSEALAQDALARQVEAAYRAGDETQARELAQRYLNAYPEGRRRQAVRRFGGLE